MNKPVVVDSTYQGDPNKEFGDYGKGWVHGLTWGDAQWSVQNEGMAIARKGWNGAGQFVYWVPPGEYPARTGIAKAFFGEGSLVPYAGYFALKNAQGVVTPWVPSIGDLSADDWYRLSEDDVFLMQTPPKADGSTLNYVGDPTLGSVEKLSSSNPEQQRWADFKDVPLYVGTKYVTAKPMTRGEYNTYRGWELPVDEDGSDEGYLVEYVDGGKANHPDHAGYISWSPKDVFDRSYKLAESPEGHNGKSVAAT